jgi:nucleotide-binding universal stress UspA family protein
MLGEINVLLTVVAVGLAVLDWSRTLSAYTPRFWGRREAEVDLVVVGSHRPTMKDYLLGTNAARVIRHARCSVLVPRG